MTMTEKTNKPTTLDLEAASGLKIMNDSGWVHNSSSSIPRRGINDYDRWVVVESSTDLYSTDPAVQAMTHHLRTVNCPGWTPMIVRARACFMGLVEIRFSTTMDSSD